MDVVENVNVNVNSRTLVLDVTGARGVQLSDGGSKGREGVGD